MKKIVIVFGTRPEAIKMCPLVKELRKREDVAQSVCITGQHKQMLDQVLRCFDVHPDYDLAIMKEQQTLFDITGSILSFFAPILKNIAPDIVLVHGDTTTAFATALSSFYLNIPVGHVEAGLRTYNIQSPYPEEFNRQAVSSIATYHFCPTERARQNLLREGKLAENIFVTGNTVIDALQTTVSKHYKHPILDWAADARLLLLTAHRRENLGEPLRNMFAAVRKIVEEFDDIKVVYPVHYNPIVQQTARELLEGNDRIRLIDPLDVYDFHNFIAKCYLVLTDSGGIQEEAPSLGKPVLVMRDTTERPEGIEAGTIKLAGTSCDTIYAETKKLLTDRDAYLCMSNASNPYGDGFASKRIADILLNEKFI